MKTLSGTLWGLSLACLAASAPAADLELEGNRLLVSGMLDGSAVKAFESQLASGRVRTVVFENSLGGSPEVASDYARAIRATGVNTEVKGQCQAACAYAFLAGKEHRFGRGFQVNGLLIPVGARPQPGDLAGRWQDDDAAYRTLAEFSAPADGVPVAAGLAGRGAATETAVPATVVAAANAVNTATTPTTASTANIANTAVPALAPAPTPAVANAPAPRERWQPNQGVLFTSTPTLFGRVNNSFYCDGTQGRDMSRCELLPDTDPYKLGVLTP